MCHWHEYGHCPTHLKPTECQRKDCTNYAHHICSIKWAEQYNIEERGIATLCRTHHPGYQKWSKDVETNADSSTSNSTSSSSSNDSDKVSSSSSDNLDENLNVSRHKKVAGKSTQEKKKVSQPGNFSKLEKFPRLLLTDNHQTAYRTSRE